MEAFQIQEPACPDRHRRLHGATRPRTHRQTYAMGGCRVRHEEHRGPSRIARSGPCSATHTGEGERGSHALPEPAARTPRLRPFRMGGHLDGVQQHVHLLHRAHHPWQGARPQTGRRTRRDPRDGDERGEGDHAAGAECELVWLWHRRPLCVLQAAARLWRDRGTGARAVHLAPPGGIHRRRDRRDGRDPQCDASAAFPAAIRIRPHLARHAPLIPFREVPGHSREDS